ncbi:M20 family metallopeptidase [Lysinibacillus sp. NPDC058147]|uniref:M20 metallopeptidase family protein n=1 Tax=unclassified Lysinibacillus TaxID=2636778 RepID=UPI0036DB1B8B
MTIETLTKELNGLFEEIVENRRYLHQNPELSFQEEKTSRFIADTLKSYGISVQENVGDKGVVGIIQGRVPGKTIAFRADFDALPIEDQKEVTYKSTVPGVMHACGHDGHTAALLAVAKVLQKHKNSIHGTAKFIFQPAEEKPPGGAKFMIEDGVLDEVDYVFGAHVATDLPVGKLSTTSGAIMASVDAFTIKIFGKGGHGARPHETKDSIIAATQLIQHLQQIVSRRINPTEAAVVTVGSIHAGNAFNVIADSAVLEGTVRALNKDVRSQIEKEIRAILEGLKITNYIEFEINYLHGYPVLVNPVEEAALVEQFIKEQFGESAFIQKEPVLGAEDFAYYLQEKPGNFFYVGAHNEDPNTQYPHHHPKFDFDERALLNTGEVFLKIASHFLID